MKGIIARFNEIAEKVCGGNSSKLAATIGVSEGSVRLYRSSSEPSLRAVVGICRVYGVNAEWIINGVGEPFESSQNKPLENSVTDLSTSCSDDVVKQLVQTIASLQRQNEFLTEQLFNAMNSKSK